MKVCLKCGSPCNGADICANCGSTSFRELNNIQNNCQNMQQQFGSGYRNNNSQYAQQKYNNSVHDVGHNYGYSAVNPANGAVGATVAGNVIKSTSNARSMKMIISLLVVLVLLVGGISTAVVVKNENTPEKTIEKLEEAYNNQDLNAMIECFDSKTRNAYDAGDSLLGGVLGFSYKNAASLIPFLSDAMGEEMPQIHLEVVRVEKTGNKSCIVHVKTTMTTDDGSDYYDETDEEDTISMVKENGKWYVSDQEIINMF